MLTKMQKMLTKKYLGCSIYVQMEDKMKKNRKHYFCNSPFLEGFASINLFDQNSSFEHKSKQPPNYVISKYFSEVAYYLNKSAKSFSEKHVRK